MISIHNHRAHLKLNTKNKQSNENLFICLLSPYDNWLLTWKSKSRVLFILVTLQTKNLDGII